MKKLDFRYWLHFNFQDKYNRLNNIFFVKDLLYITSIGILKKKITHIQNKNHEVLV